LYIHYGCNGSTAIILPGIDHALQLACMTPLKRQPNGRIIDLIQWAGLILLIGFVYRHFGPDARTPITPAVIGVFGVAVFLLLGPTPLKFKE
jgi:hypothetical protein